MLGLGAWVREVDGKEEGWDCGGRGERGEVRTKFEEPKRAKLSENKNFVASWEAGNLSAGNRGFCQRSLAVFKSVLINGKPTPPRFSV